MPRMQPFTDLHKLGFDGYSDFKSYLKFESNKTHHYHLTLSIVSNKKSIVHSVI